MKLEEYFLKQKEICTTPSQKMKIFQSIIIKGEKVSIFNRVRFYWKVGIYFVIVFFLMLGFYSPFTKIGEENIEKKKIVKNGEGYLIEQLDNDIISNQAKADYIGKIIEFKGDIQIINNGQNVKTDKLYDGDTILLLNSSEIKFMVKDGALAKIVGPAKFSIKDIGENKGTNNYVLNLVYGEYFEITSQDLSKDNLIIQTQDFEIESQDTQKGLDIKIVSSGDKKIVENNGADVVVKKVVDNKKTYSSIKKNQKAEIDENIKVMEEIKKITKEVVNNEVVKSFDLINDQNGYENNNENNENNESLQTQEISININEVLQDNKMVLTSQIMEEFKKIIHPVFVQKDIENLVLNYFIGNDNGYNIAYNNFSIRLNKLYDLFGLQIHSELIKLNTSKNNLNIDNLITITDQLIAKLDSQYHIPPLYTKRFSSILAWLIIIKENEYGKYKSEKETLEFNEIFDKLNLDNYKENLIIK